MTGTPPAGSPGSTGHCQRPGPHDRRPIDLATTNPLPFLSDVELRNDRAETTETDARSQRSRASRRGGQVLTRAARPRQSHPRNLHQLNMGQLRSSDMEPPRRHLSLLHRPRPTPRLDHRRPRRRSRPPQRTRRPHQSHRPVITRTAFPPDRRRCPGEVPLAAAV